MDVTREELLKQFQLLNDEALLALFQSDELTDLARTVAAGELRQRGIDLPEAHSDASSERPDTSNHEDLVQVTRCFTAAEANMLQARLETEGVPAIVADEHAVQAMPFMSIALGGVRVLVPESYLDRARAISKAIERGDYTLDEQDKFD